MRRVLFVDDEASALAALERMIDTAQPGWDVRYLTNPSDALEAIETGDVDVVVSDMQMPEMDGATLLKRVRASSPSTARIVMSGHTNQAAAIRAAGVAQRFLAKPCDFEVIRAAVDRALDVRDVIHDDDLAAAIGRLGSLPSPPEVFTELHHALAQDDVSVEAIGSIVARDASLTAKVLQIANSAFVGLARPVTTAHDAVRTLGLQVVHSLAAAHGVLGAAAAHGSPLVRSLASHATEAGEAAASAYTSRTEAAEAYVAGLLHDVGWLVIAGTREVQLTEYVSTVGGLVPDPEAEAAMFGAPHAHIGGALLSLWGLPESLVEVATLHDDPRHSTPLIEIIRAYERPLDQVP